MYILFIVGNITDLGEETPLVGGGWENVAGWIFVGRRIWKPSEAVVI